MEPSNSSKVAAAARNAAGLGVRTVAIGPFVVDLTAGCLTRDGKRIALQEQPFQVLAALLERPGDLITREELRKRIWPPGTLVDFDHGLNIAVNKLREASGDSADQPRFIHTVPRRGYRLAAPVGRPPTDPPAAPTPVPEPALPPVPRTELPPPRQPSRRLLTSKALVATLFAGIAIISMIGAIGARIWRNSLTMGPDTLQASRIESLAVLPLANLSGNSAQEYFADGMTDELITGLAKLQSVKVISRSSVMRFKGSRQPLPEIARELRVDGIIEGSVLRSGNRVRITVQLLRAATDQHLWAETYDGDMQDVLRLQDSVARAVAMELRTKLSPATQPRVHDRASVKPDAYEAYLRGRTLFEQRGTKQANDAAAQYLEKAIALDPAFAPAYALLADYYIFRGFDVAPSPADSEKAKTLVATALQLDEGSADAHLARANLLYRLDWNWLEADEEFKQAIAASPSSSLSYGYYAIYLGVMGRFDEAIAAATQETDLEPLEALAYLDLATVLYWSDRNQESVAAARKAIALDPEFPGAHGQLGRSCERLGRYDEAVAAYLHADALEGFDPSAIADLQRAYTKSGISGYRRKLLDRALRQPSKDAKYFVLAKLAAELGDKRAAFHWLELSFKEREVQLANLNVAPSLRSLHSDPRFTDLLRSMGMP